MCVAVLLGSAALALYGACWRVLLILQVAGLERQPTRLQSVLPTLLMCPLARSDRQRRLICSEVEMHSSSADSGTLTRVWKSLSARNSRTRRCAVTPTGQLSSTRRKIGATGRQNLGLGLWSMFHLEIVIFVAKMTARNCTHNNGNNVNVNIFLQT